MRTSPPTRTAKSSVPHVTQGGLTSLIDRMLLRISDIMRVRWSLFFICWRWSLVWYRAIAAVSGIERIMTPTPTSMLNPRSWYSEMNASVIWKMPLHRMLPYVHRSWSRVASVLWRFTMSPVVRPARSSFDRTSAFLKMSETSPARTRMPVSNTREK